MPRLLLTLTLLLALTACAVPAPSATLTLPPPTATATPASTPTPEFTPTPAYPAEIQSLVLKLQQLGLEPQVSQEKQEWKVQISTADKQLITVDALTISPRYSSLVYITSGEHLFALHTETNTFAEITNPNDVDQYPASLKEAWENVQAVQREVTLSAYGKEPTEEEKAAGSPYATGKYVWGVLPEGVSQKEWREMQSTLFAEQLDLWRQFLKAKGNLPNENISDLQLLSEIFKYVRENDEAKMAHLPLYLINYLLTEQKYEDVVWSFEREDRMGILMDSPVVPVEYQIQVRDEAMNFNVEEWKNLTVNGLETKGIIHPPPAWDYGILAAVIPIEGAQLQVNEKGKERVIHTVLIIVEHPKEDPEKPPFFTARTFHIEGGFPINWNGNPEMIMPAYQDYANDPRTNGLTTDNPPIVSDEWYAKYAFGKMPYTISREYTPYINISTMDELLQTLGDDVVVQGNMDNLYYTVFLTGATQLIK